MDRVARSMKLHEEATKYAMAVAPPPKWSPWYAATAVAFGIAIVCAVIGTSPQVQTQAAFIAGAITFVPVWWLQRRHDAAVSARYKELMSTDTSAGEPGGPHPQKH